MITQQELIDRLNQLTLRYNLTWPDIKYDADKAIAKINGFLGTKYPPISSIMLGSQSGYTFTATGVKQEIIKDEYFHSVIIPYIAMEVLARDEEFTTIYNKYMAEMEDGLFTMFQKEFNRVPLVWRQTSDQGVFFEEDGALAKVGRTLEENLPTFKLRVYYHINNSVIVLNSLTAVHFVEDNTAYDYEGNATILGWTTVLFSYTGATAYTFAGWSANPEATTKDATYDPGNIIELTSDLHLYAIWTPTSTLAITTAGVVSLVAAYAASLTYLEIPSTINNRVVREIQSYFCTKDASNATIAATNLDTIILPAYLLTIQANAFDGFNGTAIVFQETAYSATYAGITIGTNAFADTDYLTEVLLPANVKTIAAGAFPVVSNKALVIRCRILEINKPGTWASDWYAASSGTYVVSVVWGYNG